MGVKNTVMSSMIPKGTIGNQNSILKALSNGNEEAKKSYKKSKKK